MAPASKLGRGKPLKNQTKEVLHKIYKYFESEISRDPNSTVTAAQLVTHSTGISMNALKRVLNEHKANAAIKKEYTTNRRRCKKNITSDDFDAQAIRRIIHNFYTGDEEFPIMKDLYMIMKADIDYQGSLCTLRRHVAKLGFKWMEKDDNNSVLIEKHDVRFARVQYLSRIECYRSQGRNIVYTGKAAIKSSRISSKPKAGGSSTVLKQPAKSRLVILLAGDQNSLMKNTMYMFDGNKRELKEELESKRDNFDQYERWFRHQLIPNLKPNSIVVVDGGSAYHSRLSNPAPHSNSRKKEMMDYLTARSVPHSADMYKAQLYQLVLNKKDRCNDYKTDYMLREHGHTVLRIPAHHPDLNPIHVVLNSLQNYVGLDVCLPVDSMMKISKERILSLDQNDWTHACKMVEAEENSLKSTDKVIDDILETTFRNVEDSEDSDSDDESEQESGDSD